MARGGWPGVVALMRGSLQDLADDPAHAPRVLARFQYALEGKDSQLRRAWSVNAHEKLALDVLWENGRMTMTQLGERIPLSRAAVTTLTDRLEELGYVRRIADRTDRRRTMVEVTERVEQEGARVETEWRTRVQEYVSELDDATWNTVVDVLADLRTIAHEEGARLREMPTDELTRMTSGRGGRRPARAREREEIPTHW